MFQDGFCRALLPSTDLTPYHKAYEEYLREIEKKKEEECEPTISPALQAD